MNILSIEYTISAIIKDAIATTTALLWTLTPLSYWAALLPIVLYTTGIYSLVYKAAMHHSKKRRNLRKFAQSNPDIIQDLIRSRKELIYKFDGFRKEYDTNTEEVKS